MEVGNRPTRRWKKRCKQQNAFTLRTITCPAVVAESPRTLRIFMGYHVRPRQSKVKPEWCEARNNLYFTNNHMPCGCVGVPALGEDSRQTAGNITAGRTKRGMAWGSA